MSDEQENRKADPSAPHGEPISRRVLLDLTPTQLKLPPGLSVSLVPGASLGAGSSHQTNSHGSDASPNRRGHGSNTKRGSHRVTVSLVRRNGNDGSANLEAVNTVPTQTKKTTESRQRQSVPKPKEKKRSRKSVTSERPSSIGYTQQGGVPFVYPVSEIYRHIDTIDDIGGRTGGRDTESSTNVCLDNEIRFHGSTSQQTVAGNPSTARRRHRGQDDTKNKSLGKKADSRKKLGKDDGHVNRQGGGGDVSKPVEPALNRRSLKFKQATQPLRKLPLDETDVGERKHKIVPDNTNERQLVVLPKNLPKPDSRKEPAVETNRTSSPNDPVPGAAGINANAVGGKKQQNHNSSCCHKTTNRRSMLFKNVAQPLRSDNYVEKGDGANRSPSGSAGTSMCRASVEGCKHPAENEGCRVNNPNKIKNRWSMAFKQENTPLAKDS